jgi:hypothetical protein
MARDPADKLRRRIAAEAARGVAGGSDATRATFRAARRLARGWVPPEQLPTPVEVHDAAARSLAPQAGAGDRLDRIAALVGVLETVRHEGGGRPASDALEHALAVFCIVHGERPYDEELLTAALVHDVGSAIDRRDAVGRGIEALGDLIMPRTRWFVETLPAARAYDDRTLGQRARHRLEAHPDFLDVLLLAEADRRARAGGLPGPTLDDAISILRGLVDGDEAAASNDATAGDETAGAGAAAID